MEPDKISSSADAQSALSIAFAKSLKLELLQEVKTLKGVKIEWKMYVKKEGKKKMFTLNIPVLFFSYPILCSAGLMLFMFANFASLFLYMRRNFIMKRLSCNSILFTWELLIWSCLVCAHLPVDSVVNGWMICLRKSTFDATNECENIKGK